MVPRPLKPETPLAPQPQASLDHGAIETIADGADDGTSGAANEADETLEANGKHDETPQKQPPADLQTDIQADDGQEQSPCSEHPKKPTRNVSSEGGSPARDVTRSETGKPETLAEKKDFQRPDRLAGEEDTMQASQTTADTRANTTEMFARLQAAAEEFMQSQSCGMNSDKEETKEGQPTEEG